MHSGGRIPQLWVAACSSCEGDRFGSVMRSFRADGSYYLTGWSRSEMTSLLNSCGASAAF